MSILHTSKAEETKILIRIVENHIPITIILTSVYGDCTACNLYTENLTTQNLNKTFTIIQNYMSINARISCFFSLKIPHTQIAEWIKELKQFPIAGLHLQKSNREPTSNMYMLSGILKVPNPVINTYNSHNANFPTDHNNNDLSKINSINLDFKLQTF